jgi:hypothetical protein
LRSPFSFREPTREDLSLYYLFIDFAPSPVYPPHFKERVGQRRKGIQMWLGQLGRICPLRLNESNHQLSIKGIVQRELADVENRFKGCELIN